MSEPVYQIVGIFNTIFYPMFQSRLPVRALTDPQVEIKKTSHKYLIENNLIVYEKYDRHGKLISRVPWLLNPIDEKA